MPEIKKLESNIINNIAAGEIIESPSSVVKELIENSIDAMSSKIEISLIDGGLKRIIVKDNGKGMSKEDLKIAFKRHTTSKISSKNDLFNIKTLGFRGEALPSIASVSMTSALSIKKEFDSSYELKIMGGEFSPIKKASLDMGTVIKVDNLFYNLPARKKFLKNESKELNKITNIVKSYSLCYPSIDFSYYNNDSCIYSLSSSDLKNRIIDIFGHKYEKSIIEVDYKEEDFKISGFVGNIDLLRKRRVNQFVFLNERLIRDKMISDSIRKPYLSCIERNEHPFYVLNIDMPFESVDVNVHPNKNEVRFKSEKYLYHFVRKSIMDSIKDEIDVTPTFFGQFDKFKHDPATSLDFRENLLKEIPEGIQEHFINYEKFQDKIESDDANTLENEIEEEIYYDIVDVWQIHNKYLLTEIKAGLLIIDQHVAHERVLYESAKENIDKNGLESQSLLFPQYLEFQDEEYGYIIELFPYLNNLGFRIREFGEKTIIIESSPIETPFGQEADIINEILDLYVKYNEINSSFIEKMCATYACKAAVKAGEKLEPQEMKHLINRLFLTKNPYYCPHGRPIIINLTEDELDERFERK